MAKCCPCTSNGIYAHCKSCICVKSNRPCSSCQPIKRGCCYNTKKSVTIQAASSPEVCSQPQPVYSLLPSQSPQSDSCASMPQPTNATPQSPTSSQLQPTASSTASSLFSTNSSDSSVHPQYDNHKKPCIVQGCQALIAPSMWRIHMEGHVRGTFCGAVPDTWLINQNLYICHHCSSLVAISHKSSHIKKCLKTPPSSEPSVATPLSSASGDDFPSLRDICNLKCPTIRFIPKPSQPLPVCYQLHSEL